MSNFTWFCSAGISALPFPLTGTPNCDPGWLCPLSVANESWTWPQECPPTTSCQVTRLSSQFCEPQGTYEPQLCPPGFYCPDTKTTVQCPAGSYCIRGSSKPKECPAFSSCPAGSSRQRDYTGIVSAAALDVVLVAVLLAAPIRRLCQRWQQRHAQTRRQKLAEDASSASAASRDPLLPPASSALASTAAAAPSSLMASRADAAAVLEAGFARCNAGVRLSLSFRDLAFTLPASAASGRAPKTLLRGVSGTVRAGKVTAVMGPSGAGKTTFLHVLMGKLTRSGGSIMFNGRPQEVHAYRRCLGYVPQEDVLLASLTVRECIEFSARVRLPRSGWSAGKVAAHVSAVLAVLGLSHVADTVVGDVSQRGISGGERKRTNIGVELAAAPAAIFLDEPTSGLDASAAMEVVKTLRAVANLGVPIVAVIHQPRPEIVAAIDDLILLAPGGVPAYIGPTPQALPYLASLGYEVRPGGNPADDLLDIVAGARARTGAGAGAVEEALAGSSGGSAAGAAVAEWGGSGHTTAAKTGAVTSSASATAAASACASSLDWDSVPPHSMHLYHAWMAREAERSAGEPQTSSCSAPLLTAAAPDASTLQSLNSGPGSSSGPGSGPRSPSGAGMGARAGEGASAGLGRRTLSSSSSAALDTGAGAFRPHRLSRSGSAADDLVDSGAGIVLLTAAEKKAADVGASSPSPRDLVEATHAAEHHTHHGHHGRHDDAALALDAMQRGRGASFLRQVWLCHQRSLLQQYREVSSLALEVGVATLAGLMMGAAATQLPALYVGILKPPYTLISPAPLEVLTPSLGFYVSNAAGLAGSPAGVLTFGEERLVYFREAASGHSRGAYFLGKTFAAVYRMTLAALHFAAVFTLLARPTCSFSNLFAIVLLLFFCVYGMAAALSMVVRRESAALLAVIASLVASVLSGYAPTLKQFGDWGLGWLPDLAYARWANEAWFDRETAAYRDHYMVGEVSAPLFGYTLNRFAVDTAALLAIGCGFRALALLLMLVLQRDKQR